jgi:hypothetical protein
MSCTHAGRPAVWSDDNDVAEWSESQFEHAITHGWAMAQQLELDDSYVDKIHAAAAVRVHVRGDSISLVSGTLNGQSIGAGQPEITVEPGETISGTFEVKVVNSHEASAVFPVGATPNWGEPSTSYWVVESDALTGESVHSVDVSLTAPSAAGTYYLAVVGSAKYTCDQVMSCTHAGRPAVWSDDNDVAEWSESQFEHAITDGWAMAQQLELDDSYLNKPHAAAAVRITVQELDEPVLREETGHYYLRVDVPDGVTWSEAEAAAASLSHMGMDGYLATLTSEPERQFVVDQVMGETENHAWIGGRQDPAGSEPAGGWHWITGEAWEYTNWAAGEPNDAHPGEDVLHLAPDLENKWNDYVAERQNYAYIVEYGANSPPDASNDFYLTPESSTLRVPAPGVLGNDTDPQGDPLTATDFTDPSHGSLIFNEDGSFHYSPDAGYEGQDSFTYRADDGSAKSDIATVTVMVHRLNEPTLREETGHYYLRVDVPLPPAWVDATAGVTWQEAEAAAASLSYMGMNGYLATLTSELEHRFVDEQVMGQIAGHAWIGGKQDPGGSEPAGGWQWITGEAWDYTNWATGEPNDAHPGEDVLELAPDFGNKWNDYVAERHNYSYIVEFSVRPFRDNLLWGLNLEKGEIWCRRGIDHDHPTGTSWAPVDWSASDVDAGQGVIWALGNDGGIWFRLGVTPETPQGTEWKEVQGILKRVSVGPTDVVWGLNNAGGIFVREGVTDSNRVGTDWGRVPGRLAEVSVGTNCVWGLNEAGGIFVRTDVSPDNPGGTSWERAPGRLACVTVGPTGVVWGINANGGIFCREGVTPENPAGSGWARVPGKLAHASAGSHCVWAVNPAGGIWLRHDVSTSNPTGTSWSRAPGRLHRIAVGALSTEQTSANEAASALDTGTKATQTEPMHLVSLFDPSGGADGGTDDLEREGAQGPDTVPPEVAILHPSSSAGPLSENLITVACSVEDESIVRGVWVNGVRAVATTANYGTWEAVVPLSQGRTAGDPAAQNTLTVGAADAAGNYAEATATVLSVGEAGRVRKVGLDTVYRGCVPEGDVDTFRFEATAGTSVDITLEGAGCLELRDPWGETVEIDGEELTLAATGLYTVRVLPEGEGSYELSVKGTVPRSVVRTSARLSGPSDEDTYTVPSVAGGVLSARAAGELGPAHIAVLDPAGRTLAEAVGLLQSAVLPVAADYTVVVTGTEGEYELVVNVTPPAEEALRLEGPGIVRVAQAEVAAGALMELTVIGADDDVSGNVLLVGGAAVEPEEGGEGGVRSGRGSLRVRVPLDLGPGECPVTLIAEGEESEPATVHVVP